MFASGLPSVTMMSASRAWLIVPRSSREPMAACRHARGRAQRLRRCQAARHVLLDLGEQRQAVAIDRRVGAGHHESARLDDVQDRLLERRVERCPPLPSPLRRAELRHERAGRCEHLRRYRLIRGSSIQPLSRMVCNWNPPWIPTVGVIVIFDEESS